MKGMLWRIFLFPTKKEDAGRVVRIVEGLRAEGFTVWWDHGIAPGAQWDQTIQQELSAAKMVVAVWSELSVNAPWVKEEAGVGKNKGALLPVRIDEVEPPLGFGLIQMANLIDWDSDRDDPHWEHFLAAVKSVMSGKLITGLERPVKRKSKLSVLLTSLLTGALVIGGGTYLVMTLKGGKVSMTDGNNASSSSNTPAKSSESEEAMFQKASGSRLKTDYQDYIRSFPQGVYARRVREEILPLCQGETRRVWDKMKPFGQWQRAISDLELPNGDPIVYTTVEAACTSAKKNFESQVDKQCRNIMSASSGRNRQLGIEWVDCECQEVPGSWWCQNDSTYSCTFEYKVEKYVEVCG